MLCYLKIFFLEFFFFLFFWWLYMWYFCLFEFPFPSCCVEMFLTVRGPVAVLPGLQSSFRSPFPMESFLLIGTSLLFYHSTKTVFPLDSVSFCLPCPTVTLGREFVPDSLQVFLSQYCQFSKLLLELGWMVAFLCLFLYLYFEKDLPVMSAQKSCRGSSIPWSLPVPPAAAMENWSVVTESYRMSVPSGVRPQLSRMTGSGPWVRS